MGDLGPIPSSPTDSPSDPGEAIRGLTLPKGSASERGVLPQEGCFPGFMYSDRNENALHLTLGSEG